jgi:hypothetical protein
MKKVEVKASKNAFQVRNDIQNFQVVEAITQLYFQ